MEKERLDVLLVSRGYFDSREKARSAIMAGVVYVENIKEDKPGARFGIESDIVVREDIHPYVSRGGLKLEKALKHFNIDVKDKTALDIGASTGGFTDCLLKNGASEVTAIDVGYGQLAWALRNDSRVVCMERTNVRYVKPSDIGTLKDLAVMDVSFISLKKVLPVVKELTNHSGEIVCLIKPQFEAGREKVGKHGVVKDPETHREVLEGILRFAMELGFVINGLTYSPIKGPEGNIEYLLYVSKEGQQIKEIDDMITDVVNLAHGSL